MEWNAERKSGKQREEVRNPPVSTSFSVDGGVRRLLLRVFLPAAVSLCCVSVLLAGYALKHWPYWSFEDQCNTLEMSSSQLLPW